MKYSKFYNVGLALIGGALLSACAAGSRVSPQGTTNEVIWPAVGDVSFDGGKGTFPSQDHLALIAEGMTKDQLYHLLGRPHFDEGFFAVQEWDYLFHFHTPGVGYNNVSTCQYKVLYDQTMLTRSFYWKAVEPADGVCPPNQDSFILSADALFDFDDYVLSAMLNKGRAQLDALAKAIRQNGIKKKVTISGYTDYIGNTEYNQQLSSARAQTVRNYLISKGIASNAITAIGYGEENPVVTCDGVSGRQALIACLAPNRRVEVSVD